MVIIVIIVIMIAMIVIIAINSIVMIIKTRENFGPAEVIPVKVFCDAADCQSPLHSSLHHHHLQHQQHLWHQHQHRYLT